MVEGLKEQSEIFGLHSTKANHKNAFRLSSVTHSIQSFKLSFRGFVALKMRGFHRWDLLGCHGSLSKDFQFFILMVILRIQLFPNTHSSN